MKKRYCNYSDSAYDYGFRDTAHCVRCPSVDLRDAHCYALTRALQDLLNGSLESELSVCGQQKESIVLMA